MIPETAEILRQLVREWQRRSAWPGGLRAEVESQAADLPSAVNLYAQRIPPVTDRTRSLLRLPIAGVQLAPGGALESSQPFRRVGVTVDALGTSPGQAARLLDDLYAVLWPTGGAYAGEHTATGGGTVFGVPGIPPLEAGQSVVLWRVLHAVRVSPAPYPIPSAVASGVKEAQGLHAARIDVQFDLVPITITGAYPLS